MGMRRIGVWGMIVVLGASGCAKLLPHSPETVDELPLFVGFEKAPVPEPDARTVEQFDTTTKAERVAAAASTTGGARLGTTLASLGDPTDPGFWLKTPLVSVEAQGHVETLSGKSVQLTLLPLAGEAGAGSQLSLPAMRVLELSLTDLPELIVYQD